MYYFHECHAMLKITLIKKSRDCLEKTKDNSIYFYHFYLVIIDSYCSRLAVYFFNIT